MKIRVVVMCRVRVEVMLAGIVAIEDALRVIFRVRIRVRNQWLLCMDGHQHSNHDPNQWLLCMDGHQPCIVDMKSTGSMRGGHENTKWLL